MPSSSSSCAGFSFDVPDPEDATPFCAEVSLTAEAETAEGSLASVTVSEVSLANCSKLFNFRFWLPRGLQGEPGLVSHTSIGPTGPQGEPGAPGAPGEPGSQGSQGDPGSEGPCPAIRILTQTETINSTSSAGVEVSSISGQGNCAPVFLFRFQLPKGARGEQGEQGEKGEQGEQGSRGSRGSQGSTCPGETGTWRVVNDIRIDGRNLCFTGRDFSYLNGCLLEVSDPVEECLDLCVDCTDVPSSVSSSVSSAVPDETPSSQSSATPEPSESVSSSSISAGSESSISLTASLGSVPETCEGADAAGDLVLDVTYGPFTLSFPDSHWFRFPADPAVSYHATLTRVSGGT